MPHLNYIINFVFYYCGRLRRGRGSSTTGCQHLVHQLVVWLRRAKYCVCRTIKKSALKKEVINKSLLRKIIKKEVTKQLRNASVTTQKQHKISCLYCKRRNHGILEIDSGDGGGVAEKLGRNREGGRRAETDKEK